MPNANYQKGVRKERKLVNEARANGHIAFRSAGSHSAIDVCIINHKEKEVRFIQAKPANISTNKIRDIIASLPRNAIYNVFFEVV